MYPEKLDEAVECIKDIMPYTLEDAIEFNHTNVIKAYKFLDWLVSRLQMLEFRLTDLEIAAAYAEEKYRKHILELEIQLQKKNRLEN
ncbi:MAG: hypothetical protein QXU32_02515 [Nitrososphaerales archaeon]